MELVSTCLHFIGLWKGWEGVGIGMVRQNDERKKGGN